MPTSPTASTMARLLFALVVAVCASAVLAKDRYAFNQIDEIDARLTVCLAGVRNGGFHIPATFCRMTGARLSLMDGNSKESLTESVAACLKQRQATDAEVATAKACMAESLPKDLQPAIARIVSTANQRTEMAVRIDKCLKAIPQKTAGIPGSTSDCRSEGLTQTQRGYPKETITDLFIVPCLRRRKATEAQVVAAQSCTTAALALPLKSK